MAKLLFMNIPAYGHVNPTLPVVTELAQRGQQVIYYNAETFAEPVSGTGAAFRAYPDSRTSEADLAGRVNNLVDVVVYTLEESLRLLPFLLGEIEREQPDMIIFDSNALWGMQAARLGKVLCAASFSTFVHDGVRGALQWRDILHMFGKAFTRFPKMLRLRQQLVKTYGSAVFPDRSIIPSRGDLNILYTSRELQPPTPYIDGSFQLVGPSILAITRKETGFPWDFLEPGRPKIYLSLGTLYHENAPFYRTVLAAFADHPAQFILSVGRLKEFETLGPVPGNFLIRSSVPQLALLQKIDLFITHGGMNSIQEGLYYGVPLVVVPQQTEQALNGRIVARQAAGLVLADRPPYGRLEARALRSAVDKVLADPSYRQNAVRLRRSFQEAGGYKQAASAILSRLDQGPSPARST